MILETRFKGYTSQMGIFKQHNQKTLSVQSKILFYAKKWGKAVKWSRLFPSTRAVSLSGYSLTELLTVVAILGILSSVAYSAYIRQQYTSHDSWLKNELTEINKFLEIAYTTDGAYHQYLGSIGYKPSGPLLGNAGFKTGYHSQTPCCPSYYPDPNDTTPQNKSKFNPFTFINAKTETPSYHSNAQEVCKAHPSTNRRCKPGPDITLPQDFSNLGISNSTGSTCAFKTQTTLFKAECDCHKFTIIGVTSYGKGARTAPKVTDGDGIVVMDHNGIICKADSSGGLRSY